MVLIYLFCLRLPAFAEAARARRAGWSAATSGSFSISASSA